MAGLERDKRVPRRRKRRDPRARAPKRRKRRNLVKFIPTSDGDFAFTAGQFSDSISKEPQLYGLDADDAAKIEKAVTVFRAVLAVSLRKRTRTIEAIKLKDNARKAAEEIVRGYANIIRANPDVYWIKKYLLRLKARPKQLKQRNCPTRAPLLLFKGSVDGQGGGIGMGAGMGMHVLTFWDKDEDGMIRRAKPDGAVRLELFVDLVPEGEGVPEHPFRRRNGLGGWYLRSFTKSPIRVEYPRPVNSGALLVVYWARWADATGDVGMFSDTCVARVEGWTATRPALPDGDNARRIETKYIVVQTPYELPDHLRNELSLVDAKLLPQAQRVT